MWGQKLGLERIQQTLDDLGRPDRRFPVVLVAGTNGKGSTAALLSSILTSAGYRSGLFTSPHLQSVRERIRIDGVSISDGRLTSALEQVVMASTRDQEALPSYFEALTAAALLEFARSSVDIAVLEVGLGGRLDATNATDPVLSIIASIAHDHQEHLGKTLEQIAREKAGIARVGKPLLAWAPRQAGVQRVLRDLASKGVGVEELWRTLEVRGLGESTGLDFSVVSKAPPPTDVPRTSLLKLQIDGTHQRVNAAIALRAAERLSSLGFCRIDQESIVLGVQRLVWPGRLEEVRLETTDAPRIVHLDGAHNLAGARALAAHLRSAREHHQTEHRPNLLFGSLRGKQAVASLMVLAPEIGHAWLTSPTSHRALPAEQLLDALHRRSPEFALRCQVVQPFDAGIEQALDASVDGLIVCGSLYSVGEARTWLRQRFGTPPAAADIDLFSVVD